MTGPNASAALTNPFHGTATAGVFVSQAEGTIDGLAPGATVVSIRCVNSVVLIADINVAQAVVAAVNGGAQVISISLGGYPAPILEWAIAWAVAQNVIVVAAAGNVYPFVVYPAAYPACIGVGAARRPASWNTLLDGPGILNLFGLMDAATMPDARRFPFPPIIDDLGNLLGVDTTGVPGNRFTPPAWVETLFGDRAEAVVDQVGEELVTIVMSDPALAALAQLIGETATAAADAADAVADAADDALDAAQEFAEAVVEETEEAVEEFVDAVTDTASDVFNTVTGWFS